VVDLKEPKAANIIHGLKMQLYCMTWDKDDTVSSFWSRLLVIVNKIRATGKEVDSSDIISRVLTSLPDKFSMFKSNWEYNSTSESTVEEFKDKLIMAELGLKGSGKKEGPELAFEAKVKEEEDDIPETAMVVKDNQGKGHSSKDVKCSSCHKVLICVHCAYSNTVGTTENKGRMNGKFDGRCYNCGKRGHRATECRSSTKKLNKESVVYSGVSSLLSVKDGDSSGKIILHSGATNHMTGRVDWFEELKSLEPPIDVYIANGSIIQATGRGSIRLMAHNGTEWTPIKWEGVLYVPELGMTSLMSCTQLVKKGYRIVMEKHTTGCAMTVSTSTQETLFKVPLKNGQYELLSRNKIDLPQGMTAKATSLDVWHKRLGHVPSQTVKTMVKNGLMKGLQVKNWTGSDCDGCHLGKQTCNNHATRFEKRDLKAGEALHHRAWNKSRALRGGQNSSGGMHSSRA
jgi:hypothetical protein